MKISHQRKWIAAGALAAMCLVFAGLSVTRQRQETALARAEATVLYRIVSQRIDQHDAHMTSLAALVQAADPPPLEAIRQVATSIIRFYPRIVAIDVVDPRAPPRSLLAQNTPAEAVATVVQNTTSLVSMLPVDGTERLLLIKRVPADGAPQAAVVLTIDLRSLVTSDGTTSRLAGVELLLNDRSLLSEQTPGVALTTVFDAPLASTTQPLRLVVRTQANAGVLPSWELLLAIALAIAAAGYGLDRVLEARRSAREARARELLASHEAKLAHASRVNAMGELASGIAHELTQPLTAILSHSQAGQKLAARPELDRADIKLAFDAAARNAKRAGDILGRLRSWISKDQPDAGPVDIGAVLTDVTQLVAVEAAKAGVEISIDPIAAPAVIRADKVHIEQIFFNLVRNAVDALQHIDGPRRITIKTTLERDLVHVDILDNGPGFPPEVLARLFEPFFTTRPDGMGLGLSICTRLVERYGGTLTANNRPEGGAWMRVSMALAQDDARSANREAAE